MAAPVILPEYQFCDQNGAPYAGGSLATYVDSTSTPKPTYLDENLTALNENPITLDAAGRCQMWGDGAFRLVLRDARGNEIWDISATTIVSAAMAPVVDAPTIEDAVDLLGIPALIEVETDRAEAAEGALASSIAAETVRAEAAEGALNTAINAETTRAEAEEAHLQSEIDTINAEIGGGAGALFGSVNDVTLSRAINATYTNATGKPMFVLITYATTTDTLVVNVNASPVAEVVGAANVQLPSLATGFMVPTAATYQFQSLYGATTLSQWVETY